MKRRLDVLPLAASDLAEARDWYDARRVGLGEDFVLKVDEALSFVSEHAEAHPPVSAKFAITW